MFRVATTALLAAVSVKSNKSDDLTLKKNQLVCRPSELPIYCVEKVINKKEEHRTQDSALHQNLESGIRALRKQFQSGYHSVADKTEVVSDYLDTAKAHTQRTIDYLNEPQNTLPRSGAIAIGGLAGFIFAARGGIIKKVVYTTIGAGAVASICYPRQAEEQARVALFEGRKAFAVAYNFIKGVKPGEEVPVGPINKFPTSLEDLKFIVYDLFDEAKEIIFPKKK